jgi:hypothetical protein
LLCSDNWGQIVELFFVHCLVQIVELLWKLTTR